MNPRESEGKPTGQLASGMGGMCGSDEYVGDGDLGGGADVDSPVVLVDRLESLGGSGRTLPRHQLTGEQALRTTPSRSRSIVAVLVEIGKEFATVGDQGIEDG